MGNTASMAALLMLLSVSFAADYPSGMKLFGSYAVPQGASFSIVNFTYENQTAYAIVSGGEVYSLLLPNFPFVMPQPITDRAKIESALGAYYYSQGSRLDSVKQLEPIHAGVKSVRENRRKGEAECRRLLGTDRNPCSDFESCRYACNSVTSFCQNFMYSGKPGEFIGIIIDFENSSRKLDAAYAAEEKAFAEISGNNTTAAKIDAYVLSLTALSKAATAASQSPLYYGYSFCPVPDYSLPVLTNLEVSAQKAWRSASAFYFLPQTAALVQNRTLAGLEKKAAYEIGGEPPPPNLSGAGNSSNATAGKQPPPPPQEKPPFSLNLLLAAALALAGISIGAAAIYLSTRKKGKGKAEKPPVPPLPAAGKKKSG